MTFILFLNVLPDPESLELEIENIKGSFQLISSKKMAK